MNKKQFMQELKKNLKGLSKEDKEEILEDYEAHFTDRKSTRLNSSHLLVSRMPSSA